MATLPLVLYCCTYAKDLSRVKRLLSSLRKFNQEQLPVYLSVPAKDLNLFSKELEDYQYTLINEEDILKKNPEINIEILQKQRGWIQQQVIKSEFWRLGFSDNYLVMDSDSFFLRPFGIDDFIAEDGIPYSVINEGREVLQSTERFGPSYARANFLNDRTPIKNMLQRKGIIYDYGYAPFLWNKKVWQSLEENYLKPNNISLLEAILACHSEFTWYGESLLKYKPIPIIPRNELFKHYHYEHQAWIDKFLGVTTEILKKDYLGVVYQSNWETWQDFGLPNKSFKSRALRSIKRRVKYIQFVYRLLKS